MFTDTHTHLYHPKFNEDREAMMLRAITSGVTMMLLPNIDRDSFEPMWDLHRAFPNNTRVMIGVHPCDIPAEPDALIDWVEQEAETGKYCGIGEIGLDFYWDKTLIPQQEAAFLRQCQLAAKLNLGVSIHSRDATARALELLENETQVPRGIFHCFSGSLDEAHRVLALGMKLGIGGVVTYKTTNLREILTQLKPEDIVLETDAPFLPPVPYRGQRNESAFLLEIAKTVGDVWGISVEEVGRITTATAGDGFLSKPNLPLVSD